MKNIVTLQYPFAEYYHMRMSFCGRWQLFSIIVFGCISSQGWEKDVCRYNGDPNACGFGTVIGVLAFLGLMILLAVDAMFDNISGIQHRKYAVMADIGFSGGFPVFILLI